MDAAQNRELLRRERVEASDKGELVSFHRDARDAVGSALPRAFTNFGAVRSDMQHIFQLELDTWYYYEFEQLGEMSLGAGPLTLPMGIAEFISAPFVTFCSAFSSFLQLDGPVLILYHSRLNERHVQGKRFALSTISDLAQQISASLSNEVIVGLEARFAAHIAVRARTGQVQATRIPRVAWLFIAARREMARAQQPRPVPEQLPWYAAVTLPIRSLFHPDNQAILLAVRRRWQELLAQDPMMSVFPDEVEEPLITTLVHPPVGTPKSNQELYERNYPRLKDGFDNWERATSRPFAWNRPAYESM